MEKQFSLDEVNNFLKKFKEKRGKKATTSSVQKDQMLSNKNRPKDDDIFSKNNNQNSNIFEIKKTEELFDNQINAQNNENPNNNKIKINKAEDIFTNINEKSNEQFYGENENLNIFDSKNQNNFDLFNTKKETNDNNLDLFNNNISTKDELKNIFENNNNEDSDTNIFNDNNTYKENIFNSPVNTNKNENNINKPKNIINNFKAGIVLNNPLENEQKEESENDAFNIFQGKDSGHDNYIDNEDYNNIKIKNNVEYNEEYNESDEKKEVNYIFNNNIYSNNISNNDNNEDNNNENVIDNENLKENSNKIYQNNNNYYENQNIVNGEMEKLDEDQNNIQLNENIISNYNQQTNKFMNKEEINNNINQNSDLKLNYNIEEKNTDIESFDFSSIEQDYVILASNERKSISINNIYSILNTNYENQLYENYFPVSYSKEPDLNKLVNLLNIIINDRSELNEPLGHVIVHIFKYILENQLNIGKLNILQNNELKNIIIQILSKKIKKENKGIITINNLFNAETLFNQSNSNINYNITNEALVHPLEYMINLFNEKILNKNNVLYLYFLLLNIKENDEYYNHGIGLEEYDYIFENFECALFIILKYFGNDIYKIKKICDSLLNSFSIRMRFCHFVILKCLLDDFDIKSGKNYGNIFMNFLQCPTIEKIIIADIYNFILFTASSKFKKVIAKSSILIKYKYSLIKQNNKPEKNLLILNQKIYENIHQFGSISKNNYFVNHLKEFSNKKLNISVINNPNQKQEENNIFQKDIKNNKNINKQEEPQQGLFSKFINVFGFGGNEFNNENNNGNNNKISEEQKKYMSPRELWKLEHPGQPEIEYDPVLKRYKLRGIIYDDQEDVIKKKEMEKPMVAPPKSKKYEEKKKIKNVININDNLEDTNSNNKEEDEDIFANNKKDGMSGGPGNSNNRINNPFGYSQVKNQKNSKNNQKQNNKSLSQRYAVGYNKK